MNILAPAKINLYLDILGKRDDGYHEVLSLMQKISLYDEIIAEESDEYSLAIENNPELTKEVENNLITKIYKALKAIRPKLPDLKITLKKNIPIGAGLGGGSSDAGSLLYHLDKEYELGLSNEEKYDICHALGADIYFFAIPENTAIVSGIGDEIEPVTGIKKMEVLLLKPDESLNTGLVYKTLKIGEKPDQDINKLIDGLRNKDSEAIKSNIYNELEIPAFEIMSKLKEYKQKLIDLGNDITMMSGSGTTIFSICFEEFDYITEIKGCKTYRCKFL